MNFVLLYAYGQNPDYNKGLPTATCVTFIFYCYRKLFLYSIYTSKSEQAYLQVISLTLVYPDVTISIKISL